MSNEVVLWEVSEGFATLTVNREKALNALNADVLAALDKAVTELEQSQDIRGLVITGAGSKAFVAGADIGELSEIANARMGKALVTRGQALLNRLEALRIPVLACINGFALGGGLELALACHMRYAVKGAQVGLPEVKLGVIPGYGGTQRLARLVGRGRATELILTGNFLGAAEAKKMGLVNEVFDTAEEMHEAAKKTLSTIAKRGPLAVRAALEAINRGLSLSLAEGLRVEADLFAVLCETEDMKEGLAAFMDKQRKPNFKGS